MRILRVFPRRTSHTPDDPLAFAPRKGQRWAAHPPLIRPEADEVRVSCVFTWDVPEARYLAAAWGQYYPTVKLGGPAFYQYHDLNEKFTPGLYVKPGVVFTSRGCNNYCPWCLVHRREGRLRTLPIVPGNRITDNNFLQTPREHRLAVYRMLADQPHGAVFAGGLEPDLVTDEVAAEFRDLRILDVFLAADTVGTLKPLERAVSRLAWLGRERLRCYVLLAFKGETIEQAERRLRAVWEIGAMPHAQLYRPWYEEIDYSPEWRALAKTWSRPAAMKAEMRRIVT